ncbi:MAG TPA: GDSL family lipase [Clostridium sp.]|nr:GDSL family lipase [Clostridium sp.]
MSDNLNILFFGDSLTFGYGVSKENSWVYKTSHELKLDYINKGKNGDTTSSMLSRYNSDALQNKPYVIFIMGGTNDLLCGRNVDYILDNIEIMIKDALAINSQVTIGIPPVIFGDMANDLFCPSPFYTYAEDKLSLLHKELIKLCNKYLVSYIDFYSILLNQKTLFLDGIHLNTQGNQLMFEHAVKIIRNTLSRMILQ